MASDHPRAMQPSSPFILGSSYLQGHVAHAQQKSGTASPSIGEVAQA